MKGRFNLGKQIITAGIIISLSGVIFNLQSRALVGPQSSFMYSNPQWTTYGQNIVLAGVFIFVIGFLILKKKIKF